MSYCKLPSFILGFHGCDESVKDSLLLGKAKLKPSNNEYDWLGSGIYFWENDPDRALSYAKLLQNNLNCASLSLSLPKSSAKSDLAAA